MRIPPLFLTFSLFLASLLGAAAAPKIATIDATKIMAAYELARTSEEALTEGRAKLDNDPRKKALEEMTGKLREAVIALQKADKNSPEFENLMKAAKEAETSQQDLLNQWTLWRDAQIKTLTQSFSTATRDHYSKIAQISGELGEKLGYDWVLETSGATNSNLPVVLYLKNATDITGQVIAELNKKSPEVDKTPVVDSAPDQ